MTNPSMTSTARPPTSRAGRRGSTRSALTGIGAAVLLLASAPPGEAQTPPQPPAAWEFYISGGWLMPTGAQRASLQGADLTAVVVSYVPRPSFAITGTFEWARSRDLAIVGEPKLDVFLGDLGTEARAPQMPLGGAWKVAPFLGLGAGTRSYHLRGRDADATHNLAAYGSFGGEFAIHRVHLRLEVRDYVSSFKPLAGDRKAGTRNDLVVLLGLRFVKKGA